MIEQVFYTYSYPILFVLSFGYFLVLYFGLGPLFLWVCKFLERRNLLHKILNQPVSKSQIQFEVKHSLKSIFVFGFSLIPVAFVIRAGFVEVLPDNVFNVLVGVLILSLWNEVHFYIVHRIMHGNELSCLLR